MRYFVSVLPGLETVLMDEIIFKVNDARKIRKKRGKVFFRSQQSPSELSALRCADNIYQVIDQFSVGSHKKHLPLLQERIAQVNLDFIDHNQLFRVNASRKGKHSYSRFAAADAAMAGIQQRYPAWQIGLAKNHQIEFRLDLEDQQAIFSLRLTDARFRFRGSTRQFSPAALLPTVAHALVWLAQPKPQEIFIDPCCGSGTILAERAAYPAEAIIGGDLSHEQVQVAQQNLGGKKVFIHTWDARNLSLDSSSVDTVVTNLPFGIQVLPDIEIASWNLQILEEISRVLKTRGKAIVLSEQGEQMMENLAQDHFVCRQAYPLSLKGLHPMLMVLEKR